MKDIKDKLEKLKKEFKKIENTHNFEKEEEEIKKLQVKTTDPDFWEDQQKAKKIMQQLGNLTKEIEKIKELKEKISLLGRFVEEGKLTTELKEGLDGLDEEIGRLKIKSFLSGEYDRKNAIVAMHAGQGGTEAMDWVSMLYRMYLKYCEKKGWETQLIDLSPGEEAGIKSVTFKVEGEYAYGYLSGEVGTHRLVRQSPFNADKLRQTSFALVEVLPEFEEIDIPDIRIQDKDLEWQFFRASTQGGQNVQKVSTAVRLKHIPTGITVTSQAERKQEQNRKLALNLLRSKLWIRNKEKRKEKKEKIKGEYQPASWGRQIRSYVLHPYKMVKDLRTEVEVKDTDSVLDGDIDKFIEAELKLKEKGKL